MVRKDHGFASLDNGPELSQRPLNCQTFQFSSVIFRLLRGKGDQIKPNGFFDIPLKLQQDCT